VTGIRASEQASFDTAEASCESMYPPCGCPAHPGTTDSGESETAGPVMVICAAPAGGAGTCFTYVHSPPP
jgi:hypothetical protein